MRAMLAVIVAGVVLSLTVSCRHLSSSTTPSVASEVGGDATAGPWALTSRGLAGFSIMEVLPRRASTLVVATNGVGWILKIEVFPQLPPATAETFIKEGIMNLEALYANALSPYPGDLSHKVVGNAEFKPRFFEERKGTVSYAWFLLHANERLGYGATTKESVRYRSLLGWVYCETTETFHIVRLFAPLTTAERDLQDFILDLECSAP